MTGLYGVVGDPIAQSLSPLIHKGWMRDHHTPADYLALHIKTGEFSEGLDTLTRKGFRGLNITMPHKIKALELSEKVTERARKIGAANTLWRQGDGNWYADNTDAPGFIAALGGLMVTSLAGQRVLVLGAGGAARAIVEALDGAGAKIILANRTLQRAEDLLSAYNQNEHVCMELQAGLQKAAEVDFIVNTASLAYGKARLDLPAGNQRLFYDISYGALAEPTLMQAQMADWQVADGLSMLVYQAAFAFQRWFDIMPDVDKGLERARAVLEMA